MPRAQAIERGLGFDPRALGVRRGEPAGGDHFEQHLAGGFDPLGPSFGPALLDSEIFADPDVAGSSGSITTRTRSATLFLSRW